MDHVKLANATRAHHSRMRRHRSKSGASGISQLPTASTPGLALVAGARVLDLVGCTEGVVTDACADHLCLATGGARRVNSFKVRLADGSTVTRSKKQLAVLPPGLVSALVFPHPAES